MPNHIHGIIEILYDMKGEDVEDKGKVGKVESRFDPTATPADAPSTTPFRSPSQTIGSIIRGYKTATIKGIKDYIQEKEEDEKGEGGKGEGGKGEGGKGESRFAPTAPNDDPTEIIQKLNYKIWQRNYHDRIIWDERAYRNISNYIINNPKKWDEENFYKT